MSSVYRITPRKLFLEDIQVTTDHTPTPSTQYVLGAGNVPLTPVALVLYSAFGSYANDAAAAAGGVAIGSIYYSTTYNSLHTRMS